MLENTKKYIVISSDLRNKQESTRVVFHLILSITENYILPFWTLEL